MADQVNGSYESDVVMKEEATEVPAESAPSLQSEQVQAQASTNGDQTSSMNETTSLEQTSAAERAPQTEAGASADQPSAIAQAPAPTSHAPLTAATATATPPLASTTRESSRPSSIPPASFAPPDRPNAHGSPTRVYLNQNVTPHLLEGMKYLAAYEPEKPLKWLSEFLARRSAEMEGEA